MHELRIRESGRAKGFLKRKKGRSGHFFRFKSQGDFLKTKTKGGRENFFKVKRFTEDL